MIFFKEHNFIKDNIELACIKNNARKLFDEIKYRFFTTSYNEDFGRCFPSYKLIELSRNLWNEASLKERKNVIVHEVCHIIVYTRSGPQTEYHNDEWATCMTNVDEVPHIYYTKGAYIDTE